jgi:hypothetical protein
MKILPALEFLTDACVSDFLSTKKKYIYTVYTVQCRSILTKRKMLIILSQLHNNN